MSGSGMLNSTLKMEKLAQWKVPQILKSKFKKQIQQKT